MIVIRQGVRWVVSRCTRPNFALIIFPSALPIIRLTVLVLVVVLALVMVTVLRLCSLAVGMLAGPVALFGPLLQLLDLSQVDIYTLDGDILGVLKCNVVPVLGPLLGVSYTQSKVILIFRRNISRLDARGIVWRREHDAICPFSWQRLGNRVAFVGRFELIEYCLFIMAEAFVGRVSIIPGLLTALLGWMNLRSRWLYSRVFSLGFSIGLEIGIDHWGGL
jgi:hypothetical protein